MELALKAKAQELVEGWVIARLVQDSPIAPISLRKSERSSYWKRRKQLSKNWSIWISSHPTDRIALCG